MNRHKLVFDPKNISFKKAGIQTWKLVKNVLLALFATLALAILAFLVFSFVFNTEEDRILFRENRMYEKMFPELAPKEKLLEDVIAGLQYKDSEIYEQVFHSNAPNVDPMSTLDFLFASDTIPDTRLTKYTTEKSQALMDRAAAVDEAFEKVFSMLSDSLFVCPPMLLPVRNITYPQIGASVGRKMSPILKTYTGHDGLDFIVLRGSDVLSTADGEVTGTGNNKSNGRYVEVTHRGGFVTRYCNLESADVRKGQRLTAGQKIGSVGMSGNSYAPHLHYEILYEGCVVDPVNYLFASIEPEDYANMLFMATNTVQSMD